MSRILTKIAASIAMLFVVAPAVASRPVTADPNWIFHSGFDNNPRKVIDTPDAVYFFVNQTIVSKTGYSKYYSTPIAAVFKLDKNNTAAGLKDLHQSIPFSGTDMTLFAVEPKTGIMVATYTDGGIDVVSRDGKVNFITDIRSRNFPGASTINSISFDPNSGNVWMGTAAGYISVSASTFKTMQSPQWDVPVADICPFGTRIFAVIDKRVCFATAGSNLTRRSSFTEISGGTTGNPVRIMPLSENHVAYLTDNGSIQLLTFANNKWTRTQLRANDGQMLQDANLSFVNRLEHTLIPTRDGYYLNTSKNGISISRPSADGLTPVKCEVRALPSDASRYSASYDQSTYWYYTTTRGHFASRASGGNNAWLDPVVYTANAPLASKDMAFAYSPTAGFVAINSDANLRCGDTNSKMPPLPASYKNGVWTKLAPYYVTPAIVEETSSLQAPFKEALWRLPVEDPRGFRFDPLFPDVAHMGSNFEGFGSMNLADPKKMPIINTAKGDWMASHGLPARTDFEQQNWGTFSGVYCAGFDVDNNLWLVHSNGYSRDDSKKNSFDFMYWTPDARRATLENMDAAQGDGFGVINCQVPANPQMFILGEVLKSPANKTKIVAFCHGEWNGNRPLVVFDHNGTLSDKSDDSVKAFTHFITPRAGVTPVYIAHSIFEDPVTGKVIVGTFYDTFLFDPNSELVNGAMPAQTLSATTDIGTDFDFLAPFPSSGACVDDYGRLWISGTGGLLGLNRERNKVIAYFNIDNSPLPSNDICGLGWNPETKSLFIATAGGSVEAKVDNILAAESTGLQEPFLTPSVISPDYSGTVAIHDVPATVILKVVDSDGKPVKSLPAPDCGVTFWDLLDSDGNRVPTGKYTVTDATGNFGIKPMTVMVTR